MLRSNNHRSSPVAWMASRSKPGALLLRRLGLLLICSLVFFTSMARAELRWDFGGFVSQGWARSDHNSFLGDSSANGGSFDYRELGLHGFVELNPRLRVNGQVLSRKAGAIEDGDPRFDYLFADLSLLQQMQQQAGIRLGRNKHSLGFYNDSRDVAFTRPGIIMPQSIYFEQVRELQLSSDGGALYYRNTNGLGNWLLDAQYGRLRTTDNTESLFLGGPMDGSFDDSTAAIARLIFEPRGDRWRLGVTQVHADLPFSPGPFDPVTKGRLELDMTILSAQHNRERWSFTLEAMQATTDWIDMGPLMPDKKTLEAFYIQVDHRFNPQWRMFARYDDLVLDRDDRDGRAFNQFSGKPAHLQFATDWVLGVRYQPDFSWDLRAEVHRVDGTAWLSKKGNSNPDLLKQRWNMLLLQAAYRF